MLGTLIGVPGSGGDSWYPLARPDLVAAYLGEDVPNGTVVSIPARRGTTALAVTGTATASNRIISLAGNGFARGAFTFSADPNGVTRYAVMRAVGPWASADRDLFDGYTLDACQVGWDTATSMRQYASPGGSFKATGGNAVFNTSWHVYWSRCAPANVADSSFGFDANTIQTGTHTVSVNLAGVTIGARGGGGGLDNLPCELAMFFCYKTLHNAATLARIVGALTSRAQSMYGIMAADGFMWLPNHWMPNAQMGNAFL